MVLLSGGDGDVVAVATIVDDGFTLISCMHDQIDDRNVCATALDISKLPKSMLLSESIVRLNDIVDNINLAYFGQKKF